MNEPITMLKNNSAFSAWRCIPFPIPIDHCYTIEGNVRYVTGCGNVNSGRCSPLALISVRDSVCRSFVGSGKLCPLGADKPVRIGLGQRVSSVMVCKEQGLSQSRLHFQRNGGSPVSMDCKKRVSSVYGGLSLFCPVRRSVPQSRQRGTEQICRASHSVTGSKCAAQCRNRP